MNFFRRHLLGDKPEPGSTSRKKILDESFKQHNASTAHYDLKGILKTSDSNAAADLKGSLPCAAVNKPNGNGSTSPKKQPSVVLPSNPAVKTEAVPSEENVEEQMAVLYESLQAEASKIQQFKVKAIAELKQKTDELLQKQNQIKSMSLELSHTRTTNQELMTKSMRQSKLNEDVIQKVVNTREICFTLSEQFEDLKITVNSAGDYDQRINKKVVTYQQIIQAALNKLDLMEDATSKRMDAVEKQVIEKERNFRTEKKRLEDQCAQVNIEIKQKEAEIKTLSDAKREIDERLIDAKAEFTRLQELQQKQQVEYSERITKLTEEKDSEISTIQTELENGKRRSEWSEAIIKKESEEMCATIQEHVKNNSDLKYSLNELRLTSDTQLEKIKQYSGEVEKLTNERDQLKLSEAELNNRRDELIAQCEQSENIVGNLNTEITQLKAETVKLQEMIVKCNETEKELRGELVEKQMSYGEQLEAMKSQLKSLEEELTELKQDKEEMDKRLIDTESTCKTLQSTVHEKIQEIEVLTSTIESLKADSSAEVLNLTGMLETLREQHCAEIKIKGESIKQLETNFSQLQLKKDGEIKTLREELEQSETNSDKLKADIEQITAQTSVLKIEHYTALQQKDSQLIELQNRYDMFEKNMNDKVEMERQNVTEMRQELDITKTTLNKSLTDKNKVVAELAQKTQELQEMSNNLLVKDCEFNKLLSAVQNLKSKCTAAVATPLRVHNSFMDHMDHSLGANQSLSVAPLPRANQRTPEFNKLPLTPVSQKSNLLTPKNGYSTPKSNNRLSNPSTPKTPNTPNALNDSNMEPPRSILKGQGSASKPNRVVFSTPIEHGRQPTPSDSDTSVFDMETVNKSYLKDSSRSHEQSFTRPVTPKQNRVMPQVFQQPQPRNSPSPSPNVSQGSVGERLPRSKMIRPKKRAGGKKEDSFSRSMKRHKALMATVISNKPSVSAGGDDSDCFGFNSE